MSRRVPMVEKDVAQYLRRGLVLHQRKIGARGSEKTQYIIMRPVIENGVISCLVEDEETREANSAPGIRYAIRAKDVDRTMLEEIAPGVRWLSSRAVDCIVDLGERIIDDPRRHLAPDAGLTRPAAFDRPAGERPSIPNQMAMIAGSDGARDAVRSLLDGQHLVRREIPVESKDGTSNRVFWRPMHPNGDPARPGSYEQDMVSLRYTDWSDRPYGFSQETIDSISSMLARVDFDFEDNRAGPAYALSSDADPDELAKISEWKPMEHHRDLLQRSFVIPLEREGGEEENEKPDRGLMSMQMRRRENIISMMEGSMIDHPSSLGPAPGMDEIAEALVDEILITRDEARGKKLLSSALRRALNARTSLGFWDRLWGVLSKK